MRCTCRTSSLRIFVQSLTGHQVSHPGFPRSAQLHPTAFAAAPLARHRYLTRPFSAATALCSSPETPTPSDVPPAEPIGEKRPDNEVGGEVVDAAASDIPAANLDQAKRDGLILDFSPEALDLLLADHDRQRSEDPALGNAGPGELADGGSQLKRRKILPPDGKGGKAGAKKKPAPTPVDRREHWQIQKEALKAKFPEGWAPRKRLSPDAVEGIRALHSQFPQEYTTEVLSNKFEVSAEAIRRILRTKWQPSTEEETDRQERWFNRGKQVWERMAELGTKPPRRWRREGIVRDPSWHARRPGRPRTEWPYMPQWAVRRGEKDGEAPESQGKVQKEQDESSHRKLSENLL